jgi:glycosyltransferase involved in cell wall biosynthesis
MVVAGENGFLFTPGNAAELRERVEWCSSNLASLRGLRSNARRAFEARYTGEANMEILLAIYRAAQARQTA